MGSSRYKRWRRKVLLAIGFWFITRARPKAWTEDLWASSFTEDWDSDEDAVYDNV